MKVLNFGSVNIDYTYQVPHFVRPGETLSASVVTRNAGGKGFNQSIALARAGCDVHHAGHIGADGMFLKELLSENGVAADLLTVEETGTGNAIIQVDESGANCIILYGGANQTMDIDFIRSVISGFGAGDMIVLQNEINCMDEILKEAHDAGLTIALNPAPMNDRISRDAMALADWLILNETEAGDLTGKEDWEEQLAALGTLFPKTSFLLTLGTRGSVCRQGDATFKMGACKVDAVDTTAAGDTFLGFFLACITSGKDAETALLTATRASAIAVTRPGAAQSVPTLEEVLRCDLQPGEFE